MPRPIPAEMLREWIDLLGPLTDHLKTQYLVSCGQPDNAAYRAAWDRYTNANRMRHQLMLFAVQEPIAIEEAQREPAMRVVGGGAA